jgi:hypothetical protein
MTPLTGRVLGLALAVAILATPALAQDDPQFALIAAFPNPTVSFQWEMTDTFALRVEGSYTFRSDTRTEPASVSDTIEHVYSNGATSQVVFTSVGSSGSQSETTTHGGSIGVAGIFTIHRAEHVRLYLAPRVSLLMTRQRVTLPAMQTLFPQPGGAGPRRTDTFSSSSTSPAVGVSFGAVTNLFPRLALFGEAGVTYSESDTPTLGAASSLSAFDDLSIERTTFTTRAIAGVMFRF